MQTDKEELETLKELDKKLKLKADQHKEMMDLRKKIKTNKQIIKKSKQEKFKNSILYKILPTKLQEFLDK